MFNPDVDVRSIYIHWPFCAYKCHFCPFISFASHEQHMERYNNTLIKEIELFSAKLSQKHPIETLFIGGGTPSTWPDAQILDTFGKLNNILPLSKSAEVTIEVNPGTVRPEQLDIWRKIGINRVSMGVQSLNNSVLKNLNRLQKAEDVYRLLNNLNNIKGYFENVSIDLILGLPGVTENEWRDLLKTVVKWPIHHISIYFLMVHEKTPLYYKIESGSMKIPLEDDLVDLYDWSVSFLDKHGFNRYEISNFAKKGYECLHNKIYWERKPYKGFGLAACSFDGIHRSQNHKNFMDYFEALKNKQENQKFEAFCEKLTDDQIRLEKLMLGLRTEQGINQEQMFENLSTQQEKKLKNKIKYLQDKNLIYIKNGNFVISPCALSVENEIVLELLD